MGHDGRQCRRVLTPAVTMIQRPPDAHEVTFPLGECLIHPKMEAAGYGRGGKGRRVHAEHLRRRRAILRWDLPEELPEDRELRIRRRLPDAGGRPPGRGCER